MSIITFQSLPFQSLKSEEDRTRGMMIASVEYSQAVLDSIQEPESKSELVPRKKRRLNNLTFEEKLRRKKLKNREAAQNSRDKRKAYISSLETMVNSLKKEMEDKEMGEVRDELEANRRVQGEFTRLGSCSPLSKETHTPLPTLHAGQIDDSHQELECFYASNDIVKERQDGTSPISDLGYESLDSPSAYSDFSSLQILFPDLL